MLLCYLNWKKTESKNPQIRKTNEGEIILLSKCAVCNNNKEFSKNKKQVNY